MARTKRIEKAEPKIAEIVSINDIRTRRDARQADVFCGASVIQGEVREGDIVWCATKTGGYLFALCEAGAEDRYTVRSERGDEVKHIVGRVVFVDVKEGARW